MGNVVSSSCQNCVLAGYTDNRQTSCSLGRAEKFGYINVLNEDGGTHMVLKDRVCVAKRDKRWLGENPREPLKAVRQELFPRVQLFILMYADMADLSWINWPLGQDFEDYSAVDLLYWGNQREMLSVYGYMLYKKNHFLHSCLSPVEQQINAIIREDCDFYVVAAQPDYKVVNLPIILDKYLNENLQDILMVNPVEDGLHGLVVNSEFHRRLLGFGAEQSIVEKLDVFSKNYGVTNMVFNDLDDIINATDNA